MADDEEIEQLADDAMEELDERVEDWTVKDALEFFEHMESNIQLRINGLKEDLARES